MGAMQIVLILYGLVYQVIAAPAPDSKADGETSGGIPPILTFKDGNIGVNFLGFKASAGLGGLLNGDASQGGLHASAETPFGQKAGAGLGGRVDGNGRSMGGLYAGATAGGGVGASAGLDGAASADGSVGRSYAGASAGGVGKSVVKESYSAPAYGASDSGSINIQKIASVKVDNKVVKEQEVSPSKSQVNVEIVKEEADVQPSPAVKKTYVERTSVPNYVKKTIQVPTYVEKTIQVPAVVEKRVKVEVPPTIIEKEIKGPQLVKTITKSKEVVAENQDVPVVPTTTVIKTRTKFHKRPWVHYRKRININSGETPYYGGVVAAGANSNSAANSYAGFGAFRYGADYGPPQSTYTTTVRKEFNGSLIRDIFNIPISTLEAVSNLVGNIAGGGKGSVSVSKSYGAT